MTITDINGLRETVLSSLAPDLSHGVRVGRARETVEQAADLRDFVRVASTVIGGSAVLDVLRMAEARDRGDALERYQAREVLDQLRAVQTLADNPGLLPKPVDVGTGSTGLGDGMPLIRLHALDREFAAGGDAPITPGVPGNVPAGSIDPAADPGGTAFTIANVGSARARHNAVAFATFARQVRDWSDPAALAMVDQIVLDVADRAAEVYIGAQLVAAAGGTRVAGADLNTLGDALDAAEAAAGAALNAPADLLIVNPANWPKVRRAIGTSWPTDAPHPMVAVSIGVAAGTAIVTGRSALHLFRDDVFFLPRESPSNFGMEVAASRPFYLAVRTTTGVQTITGIPA